MSNKPNLSAVKTALHKDKFKHGSLSVVFTAVFIAVIILINIVTTALVNRFPSMNIDLTLASSVEVTLGGEDISLTDLNYELDDAGKDCYIYVELEFDKNDKVKAIAADWVDVEGELVDVDEDDEVITVKASKKEDYELGRKVEFVYKLGASVDEDDYKKLSKYDDDIEGLLAFLEDCEEADDTCTVALTMSGDYVVRVKATAE